MKIIAIDPGKNGGIAKYDSDTGKAYVIPFPDFKADSVTYAERCTNFCKDADVCYVEKVGAMPGQGVTSMFSFGMAYFAALAVPSYLRIRRIDVTPLKWQKTLGLQAVKDEGKAEHKRRMKGKAQQLYPDIKVTLKTADALLILEYARVVEKC